MFAGTGQTARQAVVSRPAADGLKCVGLEVLMQMIRGILVGNQIELYIEESQNKAESQIA